MPELFAVEFVATSRPRRNKGLYKDSQIYDRVRLRFRGFNKLSKTSNRISDSGSYPDPDDVPSRVT